MSCPLSSYFDAGTACKYRSKLQKQHQKHQSCLELQDIWVNPAHWTRTSNDPHQAHQVPLLWVLPARTKLWTRDWPATDPALHWHRHHIQAHPRQRLRRLIVDQWTHRDPSRSMESIESMEGSMVHVSQTHRLSKWCRHESCVVQWLSLLWNPEIAWRVEVLRKQWYHTSNSEVYSENYLCILVLQSAHQQK